MAKLRKPNYFVGSEKKIASNSLSVVGGDLVSINAAWFVVKSTVPATTPVIEGVVVGEKVFKSTNQTTEKETLDYVVKNSEVRVELPTDADLTQAMVNGKFNIDASQIVVTGLAGTQVQLSEIIKPRVGSFKIL